MLRDRYTLRTTSCDIYLLSKEGRGKLTYGAVISDEVVSALAIVLVHSTADAVTLAAPAIVAVDVRVLVVATEVDVIRQQRVTGIGRCVFVGAVRARLANVACT